MMKTDPDPDFRLSREALTVILDLLKSEWQNGWGATIKTLVYLIPLSTTFSTGLLMRWWPFTTKYFTSQNTPEDLCLGFAGMARHRLESYRSNWRLPCPYQASKQPWWSMLQEQETVPSVGWLWPSASLTPTWAGLGQSMMQECSATAHSTGHTTLLQGTLS